MPIAAKRQIRISDIIEDNPAVVKWHMKQEIRALLSMMSEINLAKVHTAQAAGVARSATIFDARHDSFHPEAFSVPGSSGAIVPVPGVMHPLGSRRRNRLHTFPIG